MVDVYILDAVRTPRGRGKAGKGALSGVHPQELFAQTLNQLAGRTGFAREDVEDVVVGCVSQVNEQGACIARNAVLAAGWPDTVTGVTRNLWEINVNGGAIALGHPLGATGAGLIGTAVDELERADKATALVTLCIGGGMGIAVVVERM